MGMDFSALLKYDGYVRCAKKITELERSSLTEFHEVLEQWKRCNFFRFWEKYRYNAWVDPRSGKQVKRPKRANVKVNLRTHEGFFLCFGRDAIRIYHLLRWRQFLTVPEWQNVMLNACAALGNHFGAGECILAHDCHTVMEAFKRDLTFDRILNEVPSEESEVKRLDDLYICIEDNENIIKPNGENIPWAPTRSVPEGWQRPVYWDSKGWWRFDWRTHRLIGITTNTG